MKREELIERYVSNKNVLDIGSVGQTSKYTLWNEYPSFNINELTGIDLDISTQENEKLFGEGEIVRSADIISGNMETYSFDKKFDVIVAGDVIEHVSNQGLFLDNIGKHLESKGVVIITTPNAKWPTVFLRPNPTHTIWHDKHTLERILVMHKFKIVEFHYYKGNKRKYVFPLNLLAMRQGMIAVCERV